MARKKEVEQEIDIKEPVAKKESYATRWFKDYAVNNYHDLKMVADLTGKSVEQQFSMYLPKGNTEVYACTFYETYMQIQEFLKNRQNQYKNFTIEICNSINIGYCNNDDEDNEKVGNFFPILEYIGVNRNVIDNSDMSEDKTNQNLLRWKTINIKKTAEYYKEIQEKTYEQLKNKYRINLRTSEAVFPIFCIFMDNVTNVLKYKYKEAEGTNVSEVSMNVLGLFDVFYRFDDETNDEIIEFAPRITAKTGTKNDSIAFTE